MTHPGETHIGTAPAILLSLPVSFGLWALIGWAVLT